MSEKHSSDQADPTEDHNAGNPPSNQPAINRRTLLGQLGVVGAGLGLFSGQAAATDQTNSSGSENPVRNVERLKGDAVASYTDVALSQPTAPLVDILASEEDLSVDDQTPLVFDIEAKDAELNTYNPTLVMIPSKPGDAQVDVPVSMPASNKAGFLIALVMEADGHKDPVAALAVAGEPPTAEMEAQGTGTRSKGSIRTYGVREGTATQVAERTVEPSAVPGNQITIQAIGCGGCITIVTELCGLVGGAPGFATCASVCLASGYAYPACVGLCVLFSYAVGSAVCAGPAIVFCRNQGYC